MEAVNPTLAELGWKQFFSVQVSSEADHRCLPARVMAVHRGMVSVVGEGGDELISSTLLDPGGPENRPTVGDWLLIDPTSRTIERILERKSLFKRPAPGNDRRLQLIAANVDTLFIVTSCNHDFSAARIERYLVLAREVGVRAVVVLTKADLVPSPDRLLEVVRALQPGLEVISVNSRDFESVAALAAHCGKGETVALVGSSGVGKSTLINTLRRSDSIATQAVREHDGKGRHTTTVRQMHRLWRGIEGGGWLVDTPGMRELQLFDVDTGIAEVFNDIIALTLECRFTNCTHATEPECAVQAAIAQGTLGQGRLERWRRLTLEDIQNTGIIAGRRTQAPKRGKRKQH